MSDDAQVLLWDLKPRKADSRTLDELWQDLVNDRVDTLQTLCALSRHADAPAYLKQRIKPSIAPDPAKVRQAIGQLGSATFAERQQAQSFLIELNDLGRSELEAAIRNNPTLEQGRRIERILDSINGLPTFEQLRTLRAVRALGLAETNEARATLREWAAGAEGATLTRAAKAELR